VTLQFLGAAGNVTGSCTLLSVGGRCLLIDCGLHQERELRGRDWNPPRFDPARVEALLLTHAHLDHSGLIPRLVRHGFRGPILATRASVDLTRLLLYDSAHLQEEDVAFKRKRHQREGRPFKPLEPLYTREDVDRCQGAFQGVPYRQPVEVAEGITVTYHDAGHILGSAHLEVAVEESGRKRTILFSGDIGMAHRPILRDPSPPPRADFVVMESTYGDRPHEHAEERLQQLTAIIQETVARGGNVVIPAFAVGRTQELLYELDRLIAAKKVPPILVFVDSPMAVAATQIFRQHREDYDAEACALLRGGEDPFDFPGLHLVSTAEGSRAINTLKASSLIVSASGMCTGGRIKHHLVHNISRPESTILFIGYQAVGTLGRHILDGQNPVRILGQDRPVAARIASISGFSAHADQPGLLDWLGQLQEPPRQVILNHGEEAASRALQGCIQERYGYPVHRPAYGDTISLED
jgi:metallo-beta-lactamase family protein